MENKDIRRYIRRTLGFFPLRVSLYRTALIHKSHSTDDLKGHKINNERLEYLGDSVLGTVVAEYLYHRYPYKGEGYLTEMRSKIVGRASLNRLATQMGLEELIDVERTKAFTFKSLGGNTFEALVGAIYLDRGYRFTRRIIRCRILEKYMDMSAVEKQGWNYKGKLIDWGQRNKTKISFRVERILQPTKETPKQYEVRVFVGSRPGETAIDNTIKAAEQHAAEKTYLKMQEAGETN